MKHIMDQYGVTFLYAIAAILVISIFTALLIPGGKFRSFVTDAFIMLNFGGEKEGVDTALYDIKRDKPKYNIRTSLKENESYSLNDIFVPEDDSDKGSFYIALLSVTAPNERTAAYSYIDKNGNEMPHDSLNSDKEGAIVKFLEEGYYKVRYTVKDMKTGGEENASAIFHVLNGDRGDGFIVRKKAAA